MISYETAQVIIKQKALEGALPSECVSVENAMGRFLSQAIFSPINSPPFDNSAMDGFAVLAAATATASEKNPLSFSILGSIAAGDHFNQTKTQNSDLPFAIEIMTGAQIPHHLNVNAVIKIEQIRQINTKKIIIRSPVLQGENIRTAGEDIQKNEQLMPQGTFLGPERRNCFCTSF
jgi:molybdopterin molybdotransferase